MEKVKRVLIFLTLRPFEGFTQTITLIERFMFYRPGEVHTILSDLHSIIFVPSPGDGVTELRFFHASLPDFLLYRSRSGDLFLNQGVAYEGLARLALKHINDPSGSPFRNNQCASFPCCHELH